MPCEPLKFSEPTHENRGHGAGSAVSSSIVLCNLRVFVCLWFRFLKLLELQFCDLSNGAVRSKLSKLSNNRVPFTCGKGASGHCWM